MWDSNPDIGDPEICHGCLSSNRRLSFAATGDWYFSLLTAKQKVECGQLVYVALCWECAALLRRTRRLRAQVQRAHKILHDSVPLSHEQLTASDCQNKNIDSPVIDKYHFNVIEPATPTLSTLSINQHLGYDAVFEETDSEQPIFNATINHEKVIVPTKYKSERTKSIEENETTVQIDQKDDDKNENFDDDIKSEPPSDDNENSEDNDAVDINFSSSEAMTDTEADDLEKDIKSKSIIVKQPIQINDTIENKVTTPLNKKVDIKKGRQMPLIKTPSLLKLEQELQKVTKTKEVPPKPKIKRGADPDYKLEEKIARQPKEVWTGTRKFKRAIIEYENFADVMPYFQEIEMSKKDIKSALEKDDAIVDARTPEKCSICGEMFQHLRKLSYHGKLFHRKRHPDLYKNGNFCNPAPILPQKSVWQCFACSRMMRREHVVTHMNRFHVQKYVCSGDGCEWRPVTFWEKEDCKRHWDELHKQYVCEYCNKSRKNKTALVKHMKSRHPKRVCPASVQCHLCPKVFSSRDNLKNHIQILHSKLEEPKELRYCVECDVTFRRIVGFKNHFRTMHSGQPRRKWPCPHCSKVLWRKETLGRHVASIHVGKTNYCCHICGKYLSKPSSLKMHVDKHNNIIHPKEKKSKPCTVCGRRFYGNYNLQYHMYTHTGERPFMCTHCDAAFTQPYVLRVHLAKKHQVEAIVRMNGTVVPAATGKTKPQLK